MPRNSNRRLAWIGSAVAAVVCFVVFMIVFFMTMKHNDFENWQIHQSAGGSITVISEPGWYPSFFGKATDYPKAITLQFSTQDHLRETEVAEGGPIKTTFNDGGTAEINCVLRIATPIEKEQREHFHETFTGDVSNANSAVRAFLASCIKATGPLMSASEHQAARKSEFELMVRQQLEKGVFRYRRTTKELSDMTTIDEAATAESLQAATADGEAAVAAPVVEVKEKPMVVMATEIVTDQDGTPEVEEESPLDQYGIKILQFSIIATDYDEKTLEQFAAKKEAYLLAEQAKAERQRAVQEELKVVAEGRVKIAEIEAEGLQAAKEATVEAEKDRDVAEIEKEKAVIEAQKLVEVAAEEKKEAETRLEIEEVNVQIAEAKKSAEIAAAEATKETLEIGGGLSEEAKAYIEAMVERDTAVAEHLSKIAVPSTIIQGANGNGNGQEQHAGMQDVLMNLVLLKSMGVLGDDNPINSGLKKAMQRDPVQIAPVADTASN